MHETLRKRVVRRLEALPEAQLYQALEYIEFLESRYGAQAHADVSGLQTLAERLEDGLRKRAFSPGALREAFQLIDVADRVLASVKDAGREILAELQAAPEPRPGRARMTESIDRPKRAEEAEEWSENRSTPSG